MRSLLLIGLLLASGAAFAATSSADGLSHDNHRAVLAFKGITLGKPFDKEQVEHAIGPVTCHRDKYGSELAHEPMTSCDGSTSFLGHRVSVNFQLDARSTIRYISLFCDIPPERKRAQGLSITNLERELVKVYGAPDVLRTESPLQKVHYDINDLTSDPDQGSDQWVFANGETMTFGYLTAHEDRQGHVIKTASVSFGRNQAVSVTVPAWYPIPIILTKQNRTDDGADLWKPKQDLIVRVSPGGDRTCWFEKPAPQFIDTGTLFQTAMTCTDFIEVPRSAAGNVDTAKISIVRDGRELATGYVADFQLNP